jgi:tetratricopeptide (TPR) repeat protein
MSGLMRLEPIRPRRWPWVVLAVIAAVAAAAFYALPRYGARALAMIENALPVAVSSPQIPEHPQATPADIQMKAHLLDARAQFDRQLAALEARGAAAWGGQEYSDAKVRSAEARGADEAGNPDFATRRLAEAQALLNSAEKRAPVAQRSDPTSRKAAEGLRAHNSDAARSLLADGASAETTGDSARAQRDYQQVLAADPKNSQALAGLVRTRAALANDEHATAPDSGAPPVVVRPLNDARDSRTAAEAPAASNPPDAARSARAFEAERQRAVSLEAQERWDEALTEYETVLKADPSLSFAQQGKARAASRALLAERLQTLIDRPELLAGAAARADALALIENANEQNPSGPVLRSQVARLQILLPAFDEPVHVALISDGATRVTIPGIGFSGVFAQREIQLKPGKYTVVGTRDGYRDVRRDITIAPGQDVQTISVSCGEPI